MDKVYSDKEIVIINGNRNEGKKIIAIDFDDTIAKDSFPNIDNATLMPYCKEMMQRLREDGHYIIVWTLRSKNNVTRFYDECVEFLNNNEIPFDKINDNANFVIEHSYPKIEFDFVVDDKGILIIDWIDIYKTISVSFCKDFFGVEFSKEDKFKTKLSDFIHTEKVRSMYKKFKTKNENLDISRKLVYDERVTQEEIDKHDFSKFYPKNVAIYLLHFKEEISEEEGGDFILDEELANKYLEVKVDHIKTNKHHPQYWDDSPIKSYMIKNDKGMFKNRIEREDGKLFDASKMPLEHLICMCCDWCSSTDKEQEGYNKETGTHKLFEFTQEQQVIITQILNMLE